MRNLFIWPVILVILDLFLTVVSYQASHWWIWIPGVVIILFGCAVIIYGWQVGRMIRKSEQEFETMYQQRLEAMGYDNGDRKREVK